MAGGRQLGVEGVLGDADQRVPHPGTVVARVGQLLAGHGVEGCDRCGERQQRGPQHGAVLDGAPAGEPDAAAAVLGDREVAAEVGGAVLPVQGPLRLPLVALGVDDRGQVAAHPVELGGVETSRFLDHDLLTAAAYVVGQGQPVDGVEDHVGLVG